MKITPCWFVGNWIAAWYQCRLRSRRPRVWATSHQPRCQQRSTNRRTSPIRAVRKAVVVPALVAARAVMAVAAALVPAPPAAGLGQGKAGLAPGAGGAGGKGPT